MGSLLRALLLLPLVIQTSAVPTDLHDTYPLPSFPLSEPYQRTNAVRGPFTRLRNSVIEMIWGSPKRIQVQHSHHTLNPSIHRPTNPFSFSYGNDVVLRFTIETWEESKALADASETLYLDVWESNDQWVDLRIAKELVPSLLGLLPSSLHTAHTPLMHDLSQAVLESYPSSGLPEHASTHQGYSSLSHRPSTEPDGSRELFFKDYQPLSVIYPWMRLMASIFPSYVRIINIGSSYEGRDILALRVGVHSTSNDQPSTPRKTMIITGGSHAREWVSISTVNYVAFSIITRYGKSSGITKLLEEFDVVFIPTWNPDGYVYTWDNDRLWRKNRQQTEFRYCLGLDLDRAWGFEWDGQSTTSNPCSENYAGSGPFEGVEARTLADWARNETANGNSSFVAFVDLHSYSQQVLYPYSFSCAIHPPSLETLQEVAHGIAKAFRLTDGHVYSVSPACEGSISVSNSIETEKKKKRRTRVVHGGGSALDWFYHEIKTKFTYQIKLRDTGSYGFLLPRSNIVPTGKETYNAVLTLAKHLLGDAGHVLDEAMIQPENVVRHEPETESENSTETLPEEEPHKANAGADEYDDYEEQDYEGGLKRRRRR